MKKHPIDKMSQWRDNLIEASIDSPMVWDVVPYQTPGGRKPYEEWFNELSHKDPVTAAIVFKRIARLKAGHLGDFDNVGDGVIELRHFKKPGFRIYVCRIGKRVYILLAGGIKNRQQQDIEKAIEYIREYREREDGRSEG